MVAQDLEMWQNKFAAQADEGAADMEDRIDELANRMIAEEISSTGRPLVKKLRTTVQSETERLKAKISSIVAQATEGSLDDAEEQIIGAVRSAGLAIKKAAQAIRSWREEYDDNLQNMILKAADVHFQILDETRNLALQQIGMKWAWTDGVTYKDWAKYHELKQTLLEWTEELKQLIVTHPTLMEAQDASAQVEDDGMSIASAAAKELGRLKQVAHWKLVAQDATDNFDSEAMEKAAEAAQNPVVPEESAASDDHEGGEGNITEESVTEIADEVAGEDSPPVTSDATPDAVPEEVTKETTDEATPLESESANEAHDALVDEQSSDEEEADSDPIETVVEYTDVHTENQKPLAGQAKEVPESVDDVVVVVAESEVESETPEVLILAEEPEPEASSAIILEEPSATPSASESSAAEPAAETLVESEPETAETVLESEDDIPDEDEAPRQHDQVTASVKATFLGAAAQVVSGRQPILDEDVDTDDDDFLSSATNAAEAAYSSAVSLASGQYSSAVSIISAQLHGTPTPAVQNQLLSSVSAAYDQAIAAASSKLQQVADAASAGVYGTPTTTQASPTLVDWSKVESIAAERLNEGKLWAELQYQSALIAMGLATATATPTSAAEKYYQQAKYNYYAGIGVAHDRYNSFISAASSAWSSMTATPTPTPTPLTDSAISMASAAGKAAESVYSKASENIASAVEAVDESIASLHDAAAEQIYNAGLAIGETWGTVISQISYEVYGQPTPAAIGWYEGLVSDAQAVVASATSAVGKATQTASAGVAGEYESVSELVSELIVGREAPFTESVLSRLRAAYATATDNMASLASEASVAAGSVGEKVGSMASKATEAAKHGKDEL